MTRSRRDTDSGETIRFDLKVPRVTGPPGPILSRFTQRQKNLLTFPVRTPNPYAGDVLPGNPKNPKYPRQKFGKVGWVQPPGSSKGHWMKLRDEPIVVEQEFDAPLETVWKAITETSQMQQWFFSEMKEFDPTPGFETRFVVEFGGQDYVHLWRLTEVIPEKRIVYDWQYEDRPGQGLVSWELAKTPNGTHLKLTNCGLESFSQDDPAFTRESCEAGWQFFVNQRLKSWVDDHSGPNREPAR